MVTSHYFLLSGGRRPSDLCLAYLILPLNALTTLLPLMALYTLAILLAFTAFLALVTLYAADTLCSCGTLSPTDSLPSRHY